MGSEKDEQMQLVDQFQTFSPQMQYYLSNVWKLLTNGLDYKIVAIFGSQSSGKSTLLNGLFGTSFAVMKDDCRAQTTRGIWLSKAKGAPFLILDVEGTDGRERGEDQDFERKSALFSMAISQVLILNMWEHSVGLYNGANMGLLKTVFEVNLALFQSPKGQAGDGRVPKTLLFFVIRDFLGNTSLNSLKRTISVDLINIWNSLTKPPTAQSSSVFDFFDIDFASLPHKVLQPESFREEIAAISKRFYDSSRSDHVFDRDLSKLVPIDGLYAYSSAIWEKVRTNKDLDLPTQQELLAQFRCDEISLEVFSSFAKRAKEMAAPLMDSGRTIEGFGAAFGRLRDATRDEFENEALRYNQSIVAKKSTELVDKINASIKAYYLAQLKVLYKKCLAQFTQSLEHDLRKTPALNFVLAVAKAKESSGSSFIEGAKDSTLSGTDWAFDELYAELMETMGERAQSCKREELKKIHTGVQREIESELGPLLSRALDRNTAAKDLWSEILGCYTTLLSTAKKGLLDAVQGFGLHEEEIKSTLRLFHATGWEYFVRRLKEELSDTLVLSRLRKRFERLFKYDHKGLPKLWKPSDDLDAPYKRALDDVEAALNAYACLDLACLEHEAERNELAPTRKLEEKRGPVLISASRQSQLAESIRKECELVYLEAKRSLVSGSTSIPRWIVLLLLVLGWNELMAVMSSPLYLMLLLLAVIAVYSFHLLSLIPVVEATLRGAFNTGKQRILHWLASSALGVLPLSQAQQTNTRNENAHRL